MVAVYVYLIQMGKRTLEQVPKILREEVKKALENEK